MAGVASAPVGAPEGVVRKPSRTGLKRGPLSVLLWLAVAAGLVFLTADVPEDLGARTTGWILLGTMGLAAFYVVRRRSMLFSLFVVRLFTRLPVVGGFRDVIVRADQLQVWRLVHLAVGSLVFVPLCWHIAAAEGGIIEDVLLGVVALLLASGVLGTLLQYFIPRSMLSLPEREVRGRDVDARRREIYVEAEEKILGKSEELVSAYLESLRPILLADTSLWRCIEATLRPLEVAAAMVHGRAWPYRERLSEADRAAFDELIALATTKTRLDLNQFHLRASVAWLAFHMLTVAATGALVLVHLLSVSYFGGL